MMKLISVNRGQARTVPKGQGSERTGIYKTSVPGAVQLTALGLEGDTVCDARHHGGPDQAVYVYTLPDYDWWSQELGRRLAPGTFGDNLTVDGLESARAAVGDRLEVGAVLLEVTAPRIPCGTLARRMDDPQFVKRFRDAVRPGLYCRVLRPGPVRAGDPVSYTPAGSVKLGELFEDNYVSEPDEATVRRFLASPLSARARRAQEQRLAKALARK